MADSASSDLDGKLKEGSRELGDGCVCVISVVVMGSLLTPTAEDEITCQDLISCLDKMGDQILQLSKTFDYNTHPPVCS